MNGTPRLYLVDFDGIRFRRALSTRAIKRSLAQLNHLPHTYLGSVNRFRFLKRYAQVMNRPEIVSWREEIEKKTRLRIKRSWLRGEPQARIGETT
jgi:hypothetical protein